MEFELRDGDEVVLVTARRPPSLAGRFAGSGMAGRLLADRVHESR